MHIKKTSGFDGLRRGLSERLYQSEDYREINKAACSLHDYIMSGFTMMYFQDPSLPAFQRRMQEINQRNNLMTLFNVRDIPKDTQFRDILDDASPEKLGNVIYFGCQTG